MSIPGGNKRNIIGERVLSRCRSKQVKRTLSAENVIKAVTSLDAEGNSLRSGAMDKAMHSRFMGLISLIQLFLEPDFF